MSDKVMLTVTEEQENEEYMEKLKKCVHTFDDVIEEEIL